MTKKERARQSAMNRVYQNCPEVYESINGTFKNGDMWAVCDSYRFIRSQNRPQDIPESMGMDLDTVIPCDAKNGSIVYLPTVSEIKEHINAHGLTRVRKPGMIEAIPGWWCNPFYLLDMVQAFPDAVYYKPSNATTALYCECEDGDALLFPVRHSA
jgi:hypothetical protein